MKNNVLNLDNVIFVGGRVVALIDFDLATTVSAVRDVACAGRLWAPLRDEADVESDLYGRVLQRLRLFADAYGLSARDRARVSDALVQTHVWCYDVVYAASPAATRVRAHVARGRTGTRAAQPPLDDGARARVAWGAEGVADDARDPARRLR